MENLGDMNLKLNFDSFEEDASKDSNAAIADSGTGAQNDSRLTDTSLLLQNQKIPDATDVIGANQITASESQEQAEKRKGGWPKGKKRKRPCKDLNAPRQPLTGYVRFLNDRREALRQEHPKATFTEITRLLASEWAKIPQADKQKYLVEAEKDKERYLQEMEAYKKTEAFRLFKKMQEKKQRGEGDELDVGGASPENDDEESPNFDIAIFTEEFLDHNKTREASLRQLRKQTTELEEQNAILSKHIDKMKQAIEKLEVESVQQRSTNIALQGHLDAIRAALTNSFSSFPLPGSGEVATLDNIDAYMAKLHSLVLESPQENESLIAKVRDIVTGIDGEKLLS